MGRRGCNCVATMTIVGLVGCAPAPYLVSYKAEASVLALQAANTPRSNPSVSICATSPYCHLTSNISWSHEMMCSVMGDGRRSSKDTRISFVPSPSQRPGTDSDPSVGAISHAVNFALAQISKRARLERSDLT